MHISDRMARPKSSSSLDARILRRMRAGKRGAVFTPGQFLDIGTRAGVDQALSRLSRAGKIRRWGRGMYDIARHHAWFGSLPPDPSLAAHALARSRGIKLWPSGGEAANLLGLSDQVPARRIYLTDGRSGSWTIAGQEMIFKHRSARRMSMSARPTGLIVSALEAIGAGHLTHARLQRLQRELTASDKRTLLDELPLAPAWMHPWLRYLAS